MSHLPTRGVHPCERRVDGERVTEMLAADEWLSRPEANKLKEVADGPPQLPRYAPRDHLHDRNREMARFDPANAGMQTYVRATRRRLPSPESEQKQREALYARQRDLALQQQREAEEANELMELRSMGIRTMFDARKTGQMYGNQAVVVPPDNPRVTALNKKLGVDKVVLVSMPLQIDTTPPAGHNTEAIPEAPTVSAPAPAPAPAMAYMRPRPPQTTLRGNTWPTTEEYFVKGKK